MAFARTLVVPLASGAPRKLLRGMCAPQSEGQDRTLEPLISKAATLEEDAIILIGQLVPFSCTRFLLSSKNLARAWPRLRQVLKSSTSALEACCRDADEQRSSEDVFHCLGTAIAKGTDAECVFAVLVTQDFKICRREAEEYDADYPEDYHGRHGTLLYAASKSDFNVTSLLLRCRADTNGFQFVETCVG